MAQSAEFREAAIEALDLAAKNLGLIRRCCEKFGCFPGVPAMQSRIDELEKWLVWDDEGKASLYEEFALNITMPSIRQGTSCPSVSWSEHLEYWIGQCAKKTGGDAAAEGRLLPARQSFYHRNRDAIWLSVIPVVVTAIIGLVVAIVPGILAVVTAIIEWVAAKVLGILG